MECMNPTCAKLHGGYQGNTSPFLGPTAQVRERKNYCCLESDHLSKPEGVHAFQQQPNTKKKKKCAFHERKPFHISDS